MYSNWVTVDTSAIRNNVQYVLEHTQTQVMVIVKANAYGHGAIPVALAAIEAGASWCGVARFSEALELRRANINCPILLLGFTPKEHFEDMIVNQVSMTIWDPDQIPWLFTSAERAGGGVSRQNRGGADHIRHVSDFLQNRDHGPARRHGGPGDESPAGHALTAHWLLTGQTARRWIFRAEPRGPWPLSPKEVSDG